MNIDNYFRTMSDEDLLVIVKSLIAYEDRGRMNRCEELVPYAEALRDKIGGDYTVRVGLEEGQVDALTEYARRTIPGRLCADEQNDAFAYYALSRFDKSTKKTSYRSIGTWVDDFDDTSVDKYYDFDEAKRIFNNMYAGRASDCIYSIVKVSSHTYATNVYSKE